MEFDPEPEIEKFVSERADEDVLWPGLSPAERDERRWRLVQLIKALYSLYEWHFEQQLSSNSPNVSVDKSAPQDASSEPKMPKKRRQMALF